MATLEERVSRIEGTLEQMNNRLGTVEADLRDLRKEMVASFGDMRGEFQRLQDRIATLTYWLAGLMFGSWLTVMGTLIGGLWLRK